MGITEDLLLKSFATYNQQIWPMQVVAYLLGFAALFLAIWGKSFANRVVTAVLSFFWLWVALLFWIANARQGFTPGYVFVAIFLGQGLLFLYQTLRPTLIFGFQRNLASWAGISFALYALVGYPAVGWLVNHIYPQAPPFGLTPCPLVAYTFGLLLLTRARVPKILLVLPLFYAVSGFYWAMIGMVEDIGMALSGVLGVWLIWVRDAKALPAQSAELAAAQGEGGWSLDLPNKK